MAISDILKEEGCHLTPEGIETLGIPENTTDPKIILKKVLDFDLREIGAPAFPEEFCKSGTKCELLEEPVLVQIQKVRNISAPKANEESKHAPRMLKLILTDGHLTCQAIEVEYIASLSINTAPGTKIQLKSGPLTTAHGFLFVGPASLKVLGGHVTHMVEKWELNRSLAKHTRGGGGEGAPPPWIPFGQALDGREILDKGFKSLQDPAKLDNVEFEAQRKGAIAEAQKLSGIKKVFGGGTKPMLDANLQKIVDAGFSEEQAENTLKSTRNNVERALKILQKREGSVEAKKERPAKQISEAPKGRKGRFKDSTDEDGVAPVKPSGKVSLFDFLEDKLPAIPEPDRPAKSTEPVQYYKEENRQDRSNTERRGGHSAKGGGRGGQRGAGTGMGRQNNFNLGQNNRGEYQQPQNQPYGQSELQRNYNYQREDRPQHSYNSHQLPNEKAPRFQKKFDGDARKQQNINMPQESPYPPTYQQQMQSNYYPDRRNLNETRGPRNFYSQPQQQTLDTLADATAGMNLEGNPQSRFSSRPNIAQNYQNNYSAYQGKPAYSNQNTFNDQNYKRSTQFVNSTKNQIPSLPNGQPLGQSFYSPYPESQPKIGQNHSRQASDVMEAFRQQGNAVPDQRNNFTTRGNGFYQANNIVGFQNASINEQARKMLAEGSEINWDIGDRCLAKYWEDNGFYDAEITGVSAKTVVVRFLAYGNHEEVLKTDCLPPNTPVNRPFSRDGTASRGESRPGRFHQPMYVPPAQRKA